jgi:hypothetical protein
VTRAAIWSASGGVTAADGRVTRHLERFELDPQDREGLIPGTGLGAWQRNGEWVRLMAHSRDPKGRYQAAMEDLQGELARRQLDARPQTA